MLACLELDLYGIVSCQYWGAGNLIWVLWTSKHLQLNHLYTQYCVYFKYSLFEYTLSHFQTNTFHVHSFWKSVFVPQFILLCGLFIWSTFDIWVVSGIFATSILRSFIGVADFHSSSPKSEFKCCFWHSHMLSPDSFFKVLGVIILCSFITGAHSDRLLVWDAHFS